MSSDHNVLGRDDRPRFFPVANPADIGLTTATPRYDVAVRTWVRSLAGMQKEALVASSATGTVWRLVSDEGPYLAGHDEAPFPLAFLGAGMAASYLAELAALARARRVVLDTVRLTVDNYYTIEGSAVRDTMVGGALPPEVRVAPELGSLCIDAVAASYVSGMLRGENTSRFTLTHNGGAVPVGRVAALAGPPLPDPARAFDRVVVGSGGDGLVRRAPAADPGGTAAPPGEQRRTLHVRSVGVARPDGMTTVDSRLLAPGRSTFHFRCDVSGKRAPDPMTLISAGIGFCFMTQLGRYGTIKKLLDGYRIAQDTHFSVGGASGATDRGGQADPVATHVYLDTRGDDGFGRALVDSAERTCFLHALCRTDLRPRLPASP